MVSKMLKNALVASALGLAAIGVTAPMASAQVASLYSAKVAVPLDIVVVAPGGAAYVAANDGLYYISDPDDPSPAVRISTAGNVEFRELAVLPNGDLLGATTHDEVFVYDAGCTTELSCNETLFATIPPVPGGGLYGIAVDAVNSFVFMTAYNADIVYRTNLLGGGMVEFASDAGGQALNLPTGLDVGSDGYLYVGDSVNTRVVRYLTTCVAPCTTGTTFASGGGITSTRAVARSSTGTVFISDGGAAGSGRVYTTPSTGGTPTQYSALSVDGVESIFLDDATETLYVAGGVGTGSPNVYEISVTAALPPAAVPTLGEWAMILFGLLLLGAGAVIVARRRTDRADFVA